METDHIDEAKLNDDNFNYGYNFEFSEKSIRMGEYGMIFLSLL